MTPSREICHNKGLFTTKMVSRDSRGEIDENIRWKSQILTQANSVGAISVLVDKLTSQVEAGRG